MSEINDEAMLELAERHIGDGVKIIAIDGRCASGKSTFARKLSERTGAVLLHMDDFFLRPEQRTRERYETPGENVDHERFEKEVLQPLSQGRPYLYRPFDCQIMAMEKGEMRQPHGLSIIEGSYSMYPSLIHYYDYRIFLDVNPTVQMERIRKRNPDKVGDFRDKWIPLEEKYFALFHPEKKADIVFDTSDLF